MGWNYQFIPKLQRLHRWNLGMDKYFQHTVYSACDYLSLLGLNLVHVSKRMQYKNTRIIHTVYGLLKMGRDHFNHHADMKTLSALLALCVGKPSLDPKEFRRHDTHVTSLYVFTHVLLQHVVIARLP